MKLPLTVLLRDEIRLAETAAEVLPLAETLPEEVAREAVMAAVLQAEADHVRETEEDLLDLAEPEDCWVLVAQADAEEQTDSEPEPVALKDRGEAE